ncbi:MAG: 16S rRNA (cytosine(1402)-N(4))-methyltransferase RsmH [Ruminococcus sp.]|nr:16S rRNA (cytosine(1402)-N(4))-methyltransferase RsmH [Ruminococcus sp.]
MEFNHIPVLLNECIDGLNIKPDGIYVDGTVGGAGHSKEIAGRLQSGKLIAIDRDPEAVSVATERLKGLNAEVVHANFSSIDEILREREISGVDGVLLDLGVSSHQLDTTERGFSYHTDAPLDMRMSKVGVSAKDIVNTYSYESLSRIIFEYGEEKYARGIAHAIVKYREDNEILTTGELADVIRSAVPQKARREKNPCKKTFQAIRIAVNDELGHISLALDRAFDALKVGGRLCVISFHSLEDRLVKGRFQTFCQGCICPPDFPVCVCGKTPRGKLINRKPIEASALELEKNKRSRSAKLRVIEKIKENDEP